ncbi:hypothetical protein NPIL_491031 [Nephila pilipes]|uniref:Uncharacterized protein n=1 Tax=Nephila pilipes TaxID=299642 RepID=A0A8X6NFI8_NEPPI|nr:hypothetical protein NPIL_491031 [Nephila pilipes]
MQQQPKILTNQALNKPNQNITHFPITCLRQRERRVRGIIIQYPHSNTLTKNSFITEKIKNEEQNTSPKIPKANDSPDLFLHPSEEEHNKIVDLTSGQSTASSISGISTNYYGPP